MIRMYEEKTDCLMQHVEVCRILDWEVTSLGVFTPNKIPLPTVSNISVIMISSYFTASFIVVFFLITIFIALLFQI